MQYAPKVPGSHGSLVHAVVSWSSTKCSTAISNIPITEQEKAAKFHQAVSLVGQNGDMIKLGTHVLYFSEDCDKVWSIY